MSASAPDPDAVLAVVSPAAARRAIGVGTMAGLGGLMLYTGLADAPGGPVSTLVLLAGGLAALAAAEALRRATAHRLELTVEELRDSSGHRIARLEEIDSIERGLLAIRPSNGFVLTLKAPAPRHWAPGLWWRLGRRVGVGGVASAGECKAMAERIELLLAGDPAGLL